MHKYSFEKKIHFVIDDDSNNVLSFKLAECFLIDKIGIIPEKYKTPFWDSGMMNFNINGINLSLIYHDMGGTELIITDDIISESDLHFVQSLAEEIYDHVQK